MTTEPNAPESNETPRPTAEEEAEAKARAEADAKAEAEAAERERRAALLTKLRGASDDELLALVDQLEALTVQMDLYARAAAEADNQRKRAQKDYETRMAYASESFARDLLPVLDALGMALDGANAGQDAEGIKQGVIYVRQMMIDSFGRHGVTPVPDVGQQFDPQVHFAQAQREDASKPAGTVLEVTRGGYRFKDRTLRAAQVIVSTEPTPPAEPAGDDSAK
jgi:molecular chaperone GrpE